MGAASSYLGRKGPAGCGKSDRGFTGVSAAVLLVFEAVGTGRVRTRGFVTGGRAGSGRKAGGSGWASLNREEAREEWKRTGSFLRPGTMASLRLHLQTQGLAQSRRSMSADLKQRCHPASSSWDQAHHVFLSPAETTVKIMPVSASFKYFFLHPPLECQFQSQGLSVLFYTTLNTYSTNMYYFFMPLCLLVS